jgi:hypothetical protein
MDPSGFVIHGLSRKVHKQAHEQAQSIEKIVTTGILLQNKTSLPKRACTAIGIMKIASGYTLSLPLLFLDIPFFLQS